MIQLAPKTETLTFAIFEDRLSRRRFCFTAICNARSDYAVTSLSRFSIPLALSRHRKRAKELKFQVTTHWPH
jgi:hypothetical protein